MQAQEVDSRGVVKINVTGSNIARVEGEIGLPLQIMTREELLNSGVQTMQDLLDRISANQSFGGYNEALGEGSTLVGYTAASLRGLGAQRTLVLLNGKRLAPYALSGGQSVDLSGIPVSALDRVEILKDGASAVYGTDAIGGVINFILRKDYQGAEAYGNYYGTEHGGGNNWRTNGTLGYGDLAKDKFNIFFSADYFKQEPLKATQRAFSRTSYLPSLGLDGTSSASFPANIAQTDFTTGAIYGFARQLNPTIPYPGGATATSCVPPYSFPTQGSPYQCRFDFASVIETIPEAEKTNVVGRFTWQVDAVNQFFAEATYYRGDFTQRISPTPFFPLGAYATDSSLPPTSPFYPAAYVAGVHTFDSRGRPHDGDPTQPLQLLYRTVELGPRTDEVKTSQWTVVAGLQGAFRGWDYALSGNYVQNEQKDYLRSGLVSEHAFGSLLHSGVVNPFGFNTDSVLQLMRATQLVGQANDNRATNYGGDLKVSRDVLSLPSGPVALALGVEGRRESLEQTNSDFIVTGDVASYAGAVPSLTQSYRTVLALFGEVNVPVTKALEANLAIRYDHYSDFGSTTNPKVSLRWQPSQQMLLRGSYGTGFRAPTLEDLFLPLTNGNTNDFFDDPLRCPVTHADTDCRHSSDYPVSYATHTGGNPAVQPEKSRQWNAGVVWQPVPEFSASADYYWVEVRNVIFFAYTATIDQNFEALSSQIVRKPPDAQYPDLPGEIDYILEQPVNLGNLETSGIDVDLRYRVATQIGQFTASLNGTYVIDYKLKGANTDVFPGGAGLRGPLGAVSRWRHFATLDWSYGAWGATLANTYQDGYSEPCPLDDNGDSLDPSGCTTRRVGAYSQWDIQGRNTTFKNLTLTLGVRNLLDRKPPLSNQGNAFQRGYDPSYGTPMGRTFYGAIRYAFK